jgi:uncharacterized iron-regulated protein
MRSFSSSTKPGRAGAPVTLVASLWLAGCVSAAAISACGPSVRTRVTQAVSPSGPCVPNGVWIVPATQQRLTMPEVIDVAAASRIVLLGEEHSRPEHHLWELETIAALHGRRRVVIALEMLQRSAQPVLDQWVAGELDEPRFLAESGWRSFWQGPADLYLPILRFARMNRVPMRALNVPWELVSRLAEEGWEKVALEDRQGLTKPAPAAPEYAKLLEAIYHQHVETADVSYDADVSRFIAAQLVWDRAFAEGLHAAAQAEPDAVVIGLIGMGHLKYGYGVPHQLAALGVDAKDVTVLLPWNKADCEELKPGLADAVFGIEVTEAARERAPLGVRIELADGSVAVKEVAPGSVAAAAGVHAGDVIVEAAGVAVQKPGDLQEIVARQASGTWLPLRVRRGRDEIEIVARFPVEP